MSITCYPQHWRISLSAVRATTHSSGFFFLLNQIKRQGKNTEMTKQKWIKIKACRRRTESTIKKMTECSCQRELCLLLHVRLPACSSLNIFFFLLSLLHGRALSKQSAHFWGWTTCFSVKLANVYLSHAINCGQFYFYNLLNLYQRCTFSKVKISDAVT